MDNSASESLVQTLCQGIFIFAVSVLSLSWLLSKFRKYYSGLPENDGASEVVGEILEKQRGQEAKSRQKMQEDNDFKASDYKERIMVPREEAKRQKKEKDLLKLMGPEWQTKGAVLGGNDSQSENSDEDDLPEGRKAARKRTIPEKINQKVADKAIAAAAARQKPKRIIKLPDEPEADEEGVISVMLRTPIGTVCQRRFYASDQIQCLLDFITTQGFSQRKYRVYTSYPRLPLDEPGSCLSDYNLGKRVVLNIEEKD